MDVHSSPDLINQLTGPDAANVMDRVRDMPRAGQRQFVDELVASTQTGDPAERTKHLQALGTFILLAQGQAQDLSSYIGRTAVPVLAKAAQDPSMSVRREAGKDLSYFSAEEISAPNQEVASRSDLNDPDATTRRNAVRSLCSQYNPMADSGMAIAKDMVKALTDSDDGARELASGYLARIGPKGKPLIAPLTQLADRTTDRRQLGQIARALRGIGTPEAIIAAMEFGSSQYAAACGGPAAPQTLLNSIAIETARPKLIKRETMGRFAGWTIYDVSASVQNRNSVPIQLAWMSCATDKLWQTDQNTAALRAPECISNVPTQWTVPAGGKQSTTVSLAVQDGAPVHVRLGLHARLTCEEQDRRLQYEKEAEMLASVRSHGASPAFAPTPDPDSERVLWSPPIDLP